MGVLDTAGRLQARHDFVYEDREAAGVPLSKAELLAAIDAVDDWVNDNTVAFNNALSIAAKTNLTTKQKAKLLRVVLKRRWEVDA